MRWPFILLALLAVAPLPGRSQSSGLEVALAMDQSIFLPGEDIQVGVRIANLSGQTLTFGASSNWLTFHVESRDGGMADRFGFVPVLGEFTLESTKAGTKWWNIQPYFDFYEPGTYLVYAEVNIPEWRQRLISDGVRFTIQPARKLWETAFGVPPAPDAPPDSRPEIRRYALQAVSRGPERRLYARVSDESELHILRVVMLDRLLSFSNPIQQLDPLSRLHVLFQTGGHTYTYCVIDPAGSLTVRQSHEIITGSRPRLAKNDDGSIEVRGGRRLPTLSDIPPYIPPPPEISTAPTNNPAASLTNNPTAKSKRESRAERRRRRAAEAD